ncbi:MAG: SCO1/SenC family protein [Acidobacteria bacterium]|nr:SCO1/SenC family protein [Acidobacteriota bacterium]
MMSRRGLLTSLSAGLASAVAAPAIAATAPAAAPGTNRRNFPNVSLVTHENRTVKFYDDLVKGKIVLFNFFYTRCEGVCIPATANLRKVQNMLGDRVGRDIFMYSISLKPEEDQPRDLKDYREAYDISAPGWTFLTGPKQHCELLRRRLGFADVDPERDRDVTQHSGLVVFGNEPLDSWTACPALANPIEIVKAVSWVDWR